jgi:hydrogenase nickel insertion protein HypA
MGNLVGHWFLKIGHLRMHEMAIAVELLGQLQAVAAENDLSRIEEVTVAAGAMRGIVPEALDVAFEAVAQGTVAEGAALRLEVVAPLARCRTCGAEYEPMADSFLCSRCNQADVEIVEGDDIVLKTVSGQKGGHSTSSLRKPGASFDGEKK